MVRSPNQVFIADCIIAGEIPFVLVPVSRKGWKVPNFTAVTIVSGGKRCLTTAKYGSEPHYLNRGQDDKENGKTDGFLPFLLHMNLTKE